MDISREVFIEIANKKYARQVMELLSAENMRSIYNGQSDIFEIDMKGMIAIRSSEPQGSFRTPGFGNSEYKGDFYRRPHQVHFMIDVHSNIRSLVRGGTLVINIKTQGNWSYGWQEQRLELYKIKLNMSDAENVCVSLGGHLPSVESRDAQNEMSAMIHSNGNPVWLGGQKKPNGSGWEWMDSKPWIFENWDADLRSCPGCCPACKCVLDYSNFKGYGWLDNPCDEKNSFICASPSRMMSNNHTFIFDNASLVSPLLHFWWNHTGEKIYEEYPGIEISWWIKDGSIPDVKQFTSKDLSGSISTPGLGSLAPPDYYKVGHEYTAVIELQHNITDVISDGALVVDVDVVLPHNQPHSGVELLTKENRLELVMINMTWLEAEQFCFSKGGHLASVISNEQWYKLQSFIAEQGLPNAIIWLGATDLVQEGEYIWSDGRKWTWGPQRTLKRVSEDCLRYRNGEWFNGFCDSRNYFICSLPFKITMKSKTQLVFTSENISLATMQFSWITKPTIHYETDEELPVKHAVDKSTNLKNTSWSETNSKVIGGFKIRWKVKGASVAQYEPKEKVGGHWEPKYEQFEHPPKKINFGLMTFVNLVQQSKVKRVSEQRVWTSLLKHRWTGELIRSSPCLTDLQEYTVVGKAAKELGLVLSSSSRVSDEDLAFAMELYSIVHFCPSVSVEAAKLSVFFNFLATNRNLNTVVAATMHNIRPRSNNLIDFTAINMWYERLDMRYNFSLGPAILGSLTSDSLRKLAQLDPPYLKEYKALDADNLSTPLGKHCFLTNQINHYFFLAIILFS